MRASACCSRAVCRRSQGPCNDREHREISRSQNKGRPNRGLSGLRYLTLPPPRRFSIGLEAEGPSCCSRKRKPDHGASIFKDGRKPPSIGRCLARLCAGCGDIQGSRRGATAPVRYSPGHRGCIKPLNPVRRFPHPTRLMQRGPARSCSITLASSASKVSFPAPRFRLSFRALAALDQVEEPRLRGDAMIVRG